MDRDDGLQRKSSTSTSSTHSGRSGTVRRKTPRKHSSALRAPKTDHEDESLTSFPSLSPENTSGPTKDVKTPTQPSSGRSKTRTASTPKNRPSTVAALTAKSPSFRSRAALFEDSPTSATQDVPGSLHYASDVHIERLIARTGAVKLVRQLAEDLANREAEMSKLRFRAEARERELKKMLREVEVSNLDIEARLHKMEHVPKTLYQGKQGSSGDASMRDKKGSQLSMASGVGELMEEAIENTIGPEEEFDEGYLDKLEESKQVTIKARGLRDGDEASTHSSPAPTESKGATKGWKSYLWSGTARNTSRASSVSSDREDNDSGTQIRVGNGSAMRRKGLNETLFRPPSEASLTDSKGDKPRASSMTSWTLKIFAGNPQAGRDSDGRPTSRGRSATQGAGKTKDPRNESQASTNTAHSIMSLQQRSGDKDRTQLLRKPLRPISHGPTGTVKSSSQSVRSLPLASPPPESASHNLGPVEMDAILPHGSRPPTLTPSYQNLDDASDYLTDRFGFIYDQRRRKKEAEALARAGTDRGLPSREALGCIASNPEADTLSNNPPTEPESPMSAEWPGESKPPRKWQDYLKISSFPGELLSQTPLPNTAMTVANDKTKKSLRRVPTFGEGGANLPFVSQNPSPSTSSVMASNAEIAKPVISTPTTPTTPLKGEYEPVKTLLTQLTELHDNLQREKTVKWNEFMRKVRAERRKEGESISTDPRSKSSAMPEASLTDGEMIGIATLGNKGKVGRAKYKEFKTLVLAGIPVAHRAKVWAECSGASALRIPGYYADLVSSGTDDPVIISQIEMDINRTLTDNVFFRRGPGVEKLNEVLLAYSRRNPEVGYCQGMNLITASLLLIMPTAEDAFWVLVSMIENILPRHYYDHSLLASRADQQVLRQYVAELLPRLSTHLDSLAIEFEALTFQWFLSLFTDCLSAEALYRVWDVLLCCKDEEGNGGSTFLFQVALALLKLNETQLVACETPGEVYAYLGGEITNHAISIDGLIKASDSLKAVVRRAEVEERRGRCVEIEEKTIRERQRIREQMQSKGGGIT